MKRRLIYGLVAAALVLNLDDWRADLSGFGPRGGQAGRRLIRIWSLYSSVLEKVRKEYVDGRD